MMQSVPYRKPRRPVIGYASFIVAVRDVEERLYVPGYVNDGGTSTASLVTGFYCIPFSPPFDVVVRKIINPYTASASSRALGIYANALEDNVLYPDRLVWRALAGAGASFVDLDNLNIVLRGGDCYWMACSNSSATNCNRISGAGSLQYTGSLNSTSPDQASGMLSVGVYSPMPEVAPNNLGVTSPNITLPPASGLVYEINKSYRV